MTAKLVLFISTLQFLDTRVLVLVLFDVLYRSIQKKYTCCGLQY